MKIQGFVEEKKKENSNEVGIIPFIPKDWRDRVQRIKEDTIKNKSLFFLFLFLSGFLCLGFNCDLLRVPGAQPILPIGPICNIDADCLIVDSGCCGCEAGGGNLAIHKIQEASHNRELEENCSQEESISCPEVYNCGRYQARCRHSQCVTVDTVTSPDSRPRPTNPTCNTDADCVLVNKDCCGCSSGGESVAVHRSQVESYNREWEQECSSDRISVHCPSVNVCNKYQVQCYNSQCATLRYDSEGADPVLILPGLPGHR